MKSDNHMFKENIMDEKAELLEKAKQLTQTIKNQEANKVNSDRVIAETKKELGELASKMKAIELISKVYQADETPKVQETEVKLPDEVQEESVGLEGK